MYRIIGGDGKEYGPISADQLRQWIAEGRVSAQTQARAEDGASWQPLAAFPEFAALVGSRQPAAAPNLPPARPGLPPQPVGDIPNYLVHSILCTILCCLPFGIVAIVFAAQVNTKKAAGDFAGAMESSRKAKMWCWISFGIGIVAQSIWIVLALIGSLAGALQPS